MDLEVGHYKLLQEMETAKTPIAMSKLYKRCLKRFYWMQKCLLYGFVLLQKDGLIKYCFK